VLSRAKSPSAKGDNHVDLLVEFHHQDFIDGHIMKLPHRRQFLHLAAGAAALPAFSRIARAQTYPTRPVRIIVGFAPGGAADINARLIGQWLSEQLDHPFIIELHREVVWVILAQF
jgi:hypothetical protein